MGAENDVRRPQHRDMFEEVNLPYGGAVATVIVKEDLLNGQPQHAK